MVKQYKITVKNEEKTVKNEEKLFGICQNNYIGTYYEGILVIYEENEVYGLEVYFEVYNH